jgi:uncharacterized protein (TIGR04255 family)
MLDQLKNPPLVEAVCEFRFKGEKEWDWDIPGRLYELIATEFPKKGRVRGLSLSLEVHSERGIKQVPEDVDRFQMNRDDGSAMVQVGHNLLVFNQMLPYPGWNSLLGAIENVLNEYSKISPEAPFDRIGLRYINRLPIPKEAPTDIGTVTTFDPPIPPTIDKPLVNFYQRYELVHDDPKGVLIHQTALQRGAEGGHNFILDLDFGSREVSDVAIRDARNWLTKAHERLEEAFVASINPTLLDKMKKGGD